MQAYQGIDAWLLPSVNTKTWRGEGKKKNKTNTAMKVPSCYQMNGFPQRLSSWNYEVGLHHFLHI